MSNTEPISNSATSDPPVEASPFPRDDSSRSAVDLPNDQARLIEGRDAQDARIGCFDYLSLIGTCIAFPFRFLFRKLYACCRANAEPEYDRAKEESCVEYVFIVKLCFCPFRFADEIRRRNWNHARTTPTRGSFRVGTTDSV